MGDNMIQAFGMTSSMFPADGGQVRVDKCHFMEGESDVSVLLKF